MDRTKRFRIGIAVAAALAVVSLAFGLGSAGGPQPQANSAAAAELESARGDYQVSRSYDRDGCPPVAECIAAKKATAAVTPLVPVVPAKPPVAKKKPPVSLGSAHNCSFRKYAINRSIWNGSCASIPTKAQIRAIEKELLAKKGWQSQMGCLDNVIDGESDWQMNSENPQGAYGIPQALPGSKMAKAGADWRTNPRTQLRWMIFMYIPERYGTPCAAWAYWQKHHWY